MFKVKQFETIRLRCCNLARRLIYETLPLSCLAMLWIFAWARGYAAKVQRDLRIEENQPGCVSTQEPGSNRPEATILPNPQLAAVDNAPVTN
jgi:hypothetical protein